MLNRLNGLASLILKTIVIASIVSAAVWVGFSIFVNVTDKGQQSQQRVTPIPPFPEKNLANYIVIMKNTGETLLSNNITGSGTRHTLNGYYEMGFSNRKWVHHTATLTIDEKYTPVSIAAR